MNRAFLIRSKRGAVLILALWVLGLLTVFAVNIGLRVRDRISLLSHLERRHRLQSLTEAGVMKAVALLGKSATLDNSLSPGEKKQFLYDNPNQFQGIMMNGRWRVRYDDYRDSASHPAERIGLQDEESKINLNLTDRQVIRNLIRLVTDLSDQKVDDLADAIYDWRTFGSSGATGFFSDDYYENLEFPYAPKKGNFETLDELLLVKGMDRDTYDRLLNFATIYSGGSLNINTASVAALAAIGIPQKTISKINFVRSGPDNTLGTKDDFVYTNRSEIFLYTAKVVEMEQQEQDLLMGAVDGNLLDVQSSHYRVEVQAGLDSGEEKSLACVVDGGGKILYWREH